MEFDKIIKKIRKDNKLTQEELASKLLVSRQAISNWENNKNLPDIEMLIMISKEFKISLDDLILGGKDMTKIEEKIINDSKETTRVKFYTLSNIIGLIFCILGVLMIIFKGITVEYIDAEGILHENFFLLPIGFILIIIGVSIILIGLLHLFNKTNNKYFVLNKISYLISIVSFILLILILSNGNRLSIVSLICLIIGIILVIYTTIKSKKNKK